MLLISNMTTLCISGCIGSGYVRCNEQMIDKVFSYFRYVFGCIECGEYEIIPNNEISDKAIEYFVDDEGYTWTRNNHIIEDNPDQLEIIKRRH